jgi:RNA polymerase sigma-70 factor (ECF subfamily)
VNITSMPQPEAAEPSPVFRNLLLVALPSLRQQAMALTRHHADAEDLVQASVTSALAAHTSFEIGTNFRAWMSRILRNRFFSNIRGRRETVDIDDAPASQLGRSGGQEENIAVQELGRHLQRLPASQREVLMMVSFQGLSYDEASDQLGVAVGTLKSRVFRARAQILLWDYGEKTDAAAIDEPTLRWSEYITAPTDRRYAVSRMAGNVT